MSTEEPTGDLRCSGCGHRAHLHREHTGCWQDVGEHEDGSTLWCACRSFGRSARVGAGDPE